MRRRAAKGTSIGSNVRGRVAYGWPGLFSQFWEILGADWEVGRGEVPHA